MASLGVTFEIVAMDDGVCEFSGVVEAGIGYEVDVMEDGAIKEQIKTSELPEAAPAALESTWPASNLSMFSAA